MPAKIVFSDAQLADMVRMYEGGMSCFDISNEFLCSKNTIRSNLLAHGVRLDASPRISKKALGVKRHVGPKNISEQERQRRRDRATGNCYSVGRVISEVTREKLRVAAKNRIAKNPDHLLKIQSKAKALRKISDSERVSRAKARSVFKQLLRRTLNWSGVKKQKRTQELLGYSCAELRAHIESLFEPGMSWGNRSSFEIDHVIPVYAFFANGVTDPMIINALQNLRPVTPELNRSKSATYDMRMFESDIEKMRRQVRRIT